MKTSVMVFFVAVIVSAGLNAQNASSYFPSDVGYTWNYKVTPLDSNNNEIDAKGVYEIDSFAVVQDYKGKSANVIFSKTGLSENVASIPFSDTSYTYLEGSDAYIYFELFNIDSILNSKVAANNTVKQGMLRKVSDISGWFSFYRFAAAVNTPYQIFSIDTVVSLDSVNNLSVRFEVNGTRNDDENINLNGEAFNCKKFTINSKVSYLLSPTLPLALFTISDTVWISSGQWIVQDILPTTKIDLSLAGLGVINLPGSKTVLISQLPTDIKNESARINNFELFQNYPNPFNPSTKITYYIEKNTNVELTVYDLIGNKVATLINKEQSAGNHQINFNPSLVSGGLSTGVYFYRLKTSSGVITKKLLYLK